MATIPTTPTPTIPATPATPTPTPARPSRPKTGEMNFELRRLDPPLRLRQVARDPTWDRFKTIMVIIGGLLFFWVFGEKMYNWGTGNSSSSVPTQVWQPAGSIPPVPAPAPTAPPQVTVNIPDRIEIDATVRNDTASPSASVPSRELTPEEKANQFWDRALRRDP